MAVISTIARLLNPLLEADIIRRIRRNHAFEHATIHMLNRQRYRLSGRSSPNGFVIVGDVPTEKLEAAAHEALRRMQRGEHHWAIHPNCGTNLVTTGLLMTIIAAFGFTGASRKSAWERFPYVMLVMMGASIYSPTLGAALQQHITTKGDIGDLELVSVTRREIKMPLGGKAILHHVITQRG